jgi:hypothetical protein
MRHWVSRRCFEVSSLERINRTQLEDLPVAYAHLGAAEVAEEKIRKYAELIVEVVKARGVI